MADPFFQKSQPGEKSANIGVARPLKRCQLEGESYFSYLCLLVALGSSRGKVQGIYAGIGTKWKGGLPSDNTGILPSYQGAPSWKLGAPGNWRGERGKGGEARGEGVRSQPHPDPALAEEC